MLEDVASCLYFCPWIKTTCTAANLSYQQPSHSEIQENLRGIYSKNICSLSLSKERQADADQNIKSRNYPQLRV